MIETLVESWQFYEEMARDGAYGDIVAEEGQVALPPSLQMEADFFITQLRGRAAVVDVGCGLGFPSLLLAPHVGLLVGVDAAPTMVARLQVHAAEFGLSALHTARARANALPFADGSFDGAVLCGTMGSVTRPQELLAELHRVLEPGGTVACLSEDFVDKMVADAGKPFRYLRMDHSQLSLQVISYLREPYRICDHRYCIAQESALYGKLTAEHPGSHFWRAPTELRPGDLPPGAVVAIRYDEAIQFDPEMLTIAFASAGFRVRSLEERWHLPVAHIFATFEKI